MTRTAPVNQGRADGEFLKRALDVGDRLRDGTVVLAVDPKKNKALFVPNAIFGGLSFFDWQDDIVKESNAKKLHGHNNWRRMTDAEAETLANVWVKVAPRGLRGRAAPWFWVASHDGDYHGRVRKGGEADWFAKSRNYSFQVPLVRRGSARSLDII